MVNVTYTLKYTPRWTFDLDNGNIAQKYLTNAGIPLSSFPLKTPGQLNSCDDLFAMPHADPVWGTHKNLLSWNQTSKGWIWAACHAVSAMENIYNPTNPSQQLNFLSNNFAGFGADQNAASTWAGNSLVLWTTHADPVTPFTYAFPSDPEMQFMGLVDGGVGANGSERGYMPYNATSGGAPGRVASWRTSTKIAVYDNSPAATNPNIPEFSNGLVAEVAYGRAFGDINRGAVMYEGGHDHDGTSTAFVAAQRIFFNFSFLSTFDKDPFPLPGGPPSIFSGTGGEYTVVLSKPGFNLSDYFVEWSSSCAGNFSNKYGASTHFTPTGLTACGPCTLTVTVTDACGRQFYEVLDITVCPAPPVALDRVTENINNPPGTGPQPVAAITPLAGTDPDGTVVTYTITVLPAVAQGVLFYDHDGLPGTPDQTVPVNTALTAAQMASIKFDPADGFGGDAVFNYTVTDNITLSDATPATYTIPVNPPPVAQNILTTPVNSTAGPTTVEPGLIATDNGTIINYTITALPPASQGILYLNGVPVTVGQILSPAQTTKLSFDPSGTYVGYAAVTYTATDNNGATDPTPATVSIQIVNQPPAAQDISAPAIANPNGTGQTTIPSLNATDTDGTVVTYTVTSVPPVTEAVLYYFNGTIYTEVTGGLVLTTAQAASLRIDPADGFSGNTSFQYTATDNNGLVDNTPATYNIPIGIIPPVASNINHAAIYSGAGQTAIDPLSGSDPDATDIINSYTITLLPMVNQGVLYYNNGTGFVPVTTGIALTPAQMATLQFDPADGSAGNAVFSYSVTDDEGLTDQSAATYTIPLINTAPVANNVNTAALNSTDGPVLISPLSAGDTDGTVATYTITSLPNPALGVLLLSAVPVTIGQVLTPAQIAGLQFDPAPGGSGNASFNFTATDDQGATDSTPAVYTIPITFVPQPPFTDDKINSSIPVNAGATGIDVLTGSDADGSIVSFTVTALPPAVQGILYLNGVPVTNGQVIPAYQANQLTFDPGGTFTGNTIFNYAATDNNGLTDASPAVFTIPIVNQPPVAQNITVPQVRINTTVGLAPLIGTDSDGTIASYTISTLPTLGVLQVDLPGTGVFTVVTPGQVLTPAQATRLRILSGAIIGSSTFTYTTTDNNGVADASPATYTIPIAAAADPAGQPPIAADKLNVAINASAGVTNTLALTATDPDGSITGYTILTVPPPYAGTLYYFNGTVNVPVTEGGTTLTTAQAALIRFDPSGNYIGEISFQYTATDNTGNVDPTPARYIIPINNNPPAAANVTNAAINSSAGPTTISSLTAADPDGTVQSYTITALPSVNQGVIYLDGVAVLQGQVISTSQATRLQFDPNPSFSGNTVFSFTAVDNLNAADQTPAAFTIPITNQPPVADDKLSQSIINNNGTGQQLIPAVTGTDKDGTIASFTVSTIPAAAQGVLFYFNGTSDVPVTAGLLLTPAQGATLKFDPADGFAGIAAFNYTSTDNSGLTDATPAVYEIPVNTPPVTNNIRSQAFYAAGVNAAIPLLTGTDNGSIQFFSIATLPPANQGTLFLNGVAVTDLAQVDTLTNAQVAQLSFTPAPTFTGTTFTYTASDNQGVVDVTPAVYTIPQKIFSSGKVWNDANGTLVQDAGEADVNGTNAGGGVPSGEVLYINLIDAAGVVIASANVLADGSYTFPDVPTSQVFTAQLTTVQGTMGNPKPATLIPAGWVITGENKNGNGGLADNTANGEIIMNTNNTNILSQNFGIERLPNSTDHSAIIATPMIDQFITLNGGTNPPVLSGSDPEDCGVGCMLTGRSLIIDVLPANSELYYNGVLVTTAQLISNFNPSLLQIKITAATLGATSTSFQYSFVDAAGKKDVTAATYMVSWFTALPVTGLELTAKLEGTKTKLNWKTETEYNSSHFIVERSTDNIHFTALDRVAAAGNSFNRQNYQYTDDIAAQMMNRILYYRIRQVDVDARYQLSNLAAVRLAGEAGVQIWPSPFSSSFTVNIRTTSNTGLTLVLTDPSGKVVRMMKESVRSGVTQLVITGLDHLPQGMYFVRITETATGKVSVEKLIKNQ